MYIDINLVLVITAIAWCYALRCGYISDDHAAVCQRFDIIPDAEKVDRGEKFWTKLFNDGPVLYYHTRLFWALGFRSFPFFWHLFSYTLHLCNTYLLYLFLVGVVGHDTAIIAALLWSINPMMNQNVVWISGRPYLFGMFFALIALIGWQNPFCFIPFYLLAVATNISIFFVPVINLMIRQEWQSWLYLGFMVMGAVPFLVWKFNQRFTKGLVIDRDNFRPKLRKINTFARMVFYYSYCLIAPTNMGWYHQEGFRYNPDWERFNYKSAIGYGLLALMLAYGGIGGRIFLLGFLPVSNIYATNSFLQDRYTYFMSVGFWIMAAPLFGQHPFLVWMAVAFYVSRAYSYSRHMRNDEEMYRENWRNHPLSDHAINNLSYFLIHQRRYDEARVIILQGLDINRTNMMLWYNLGITFACQGHYGNDEGKFRLIKAIECFKTALEIEPRWQKPAHDMKLIVQSLIDNKVLTVNKDESAMGLSISVPRFAGLNLEGGK